MKPKQSPLGVFDSGVGGLTVVHAIQNLLPQESIIYLGDTARVPYGNKSPETVGRFAREVCRFLHGKGVKAIVIACNTASAHALPEIQKEFDVPIFGVIRPGVEAALQSTRNGRIGIIGTVGTIQSRAYQEALLHLRPGLHITAKATPLLVPLIEENWIDHEATRLVLADYLAEFQQAEIDTLVLACTHYPLLTGVLDRVLGGKVRLVDSATACARNLRDHLEALDQFTDAEAPGRTEIYLTDRPLHFATLSRRFLRNPTDEMQVVDLG
jgi:glutamate racemase